MENNLENKITPLSPAEVAERRERGQVNIIPDKITKSHLEILRTHTFTLFNGMNFLVAVALFAVGAYRNMIFFLAICLNIFVAVAQEFYAKHLVEKLSIIGQAKTVVLREEGELEISIEELVLDDISVLTAGSQICADAVLLAGQLEVDESLLTGESDAVVKLPGDKLMSGSFVISGHGQARVTAVGNDNYAAKIAREAKIYKKLNSKLVLSMRKITSITGWLILPLGALLMAQALHIRGDSLQDAVVFSSAALLGFLPNGLVLMISAALIAGIAKLARMKVLVQDLYAIECLARVDVLCLDKTGTITEGKMQVQQVLPLGEQPFALESVMCKLLSALPDNNATFTALRGYFAEVEGATAVASTPFSAQRKYCAAAFEDTGVIVLGAPEVLYGATPLPREILAAQGEGLRVLSVGFIADPFAPQEEWVKLQTPFACIILSDPIRPDTHQTLEYFRGEGVRVKIISGDNPVTVSNVARLAGFAAYQSYVDMSAVADKNIAMVATKYDIFGRVSPEQKKMLVRAMREAGSTVAMTGDGVNDVLALREADCSIAMASGSDAAKQASQLVLVNSDVAALTKALAEGRRVINNMTRLGCVFLLKTGYIMLLTFFNLIFNRLHPFAPIQMLFYDLAIQGFPGIMLALEPNSKRVTTEFLPYAVKRAIPHSIYIMMVIAFMTFAHESLGITVEAAQTIMFLMTGFVAGIAMVRICLPMNKFRALICAMSVGGFFTATFLFRGFLELEQPDLLGWAVFAVMALLSIPVVSLGVWAMRRIFERPQPAVAKRND